jgi:hypothetical protein
LAATIRAHAATARNSRSATALDASGEGLLRLLNRLRGQARSHSELRLTQDLCSPPILWELASQLPQDVVTDSNPFAANWLALVTGQLSE